jgi:HSP20 family protein
MKSNRWFSAIQTKFNHAWEKIKGGKILTNGISNLLPIQDFTASKAFDTQISLPGLDKNDVKIEVQGDYLVVSSEKKYEKEDRNAHWYRKETGYSVFRRVFRLPENADPDRVRAEMKNGVLSISMPEKKGYHAHTKLIPVS